MASRVAAASLVFHSHPMLSRQLRSTVVSGRLRGSLLTRGRGRGLTTSARRGSRLGRGRCRRGLRGACGRGLCGDARSLSLTSRLRFSLTLFLGLPLIIRGLGRLDGFLDRLRGLLSLRQRLGFAGLLDDGVQLFERLVIQDTAVYLLRGLLC